MRIGEAFPGKYIKTEDLQGRKVTVTIDRVVMEEVGQGNDKDHKAVIYFVGKERGMVLNRTNADNITNLLGTDETDEWHGRQIMLVPDKTMFSGKRVDCIRVGAAVPANGRQAQAPPPPPPQPEPEFVPSDEDIPF